MPRFHFDIHDGEETVDDDGLELPDLDAAETHALIALKALISWSGSEWDEQQAIVVRSDAGDKLSRASVKIELKRYSS